MVTLPLKSPDAVTEPTVIFGVPVNPVAAPLNEVAVTTPVTFKPAPNVGAPVPAALE